MRFDEDRCLKCGKPIPDSEFWYCSDDCYNAAIADYLPDRFKRGIEHDERYKYLDRHATAQEVVEYTVAWEAAFHEASLIAKQQLDSRIDQEAALAQRRQDDKDQKVIEKQQLLEAERQAAEATFQELIKPRSIPEHLRIHTAVIAKTGWGKTQLLQALTVKELRKPNPPSMIILDSTGKMVERIQKLAVFHGSLQDRILIIDPAHSPALNMFDVSNPRFNSYSAEQKESVQSDIIGLFNYIFSSKDYDMSGQQGLGLAYAVRLILSRPGYTVTDLRLLLEENPKPTWERSKFADDIRKLDSDARDFFQYHFYADPTLKSTKAAIARRLHALIAMPAFRRMFTADSNVLDLFSETQEKGTIVLVNVNQRLLGRDGYILFGRYVVARAMAAMLERAYIPERQRRTTHLIIDEAAPYFDESFDELLTQVRQYGLKVTVAFQHLEQLSDKLKNSVAGQTSVKYVGGLSPLDEKRVAAQIRCEPEFISNLELDVNDPPRWSEWAVYCDGLTKHPMRLRQPFFMLENEPVMTDVQHQALVARNKDRVAPRTADKRPEPTGVDTHAPIAHEGRPPIRDHPPPTPQPEPPSNSGEGDPAEPARKWGN